MTAKIRHIAIFSHDTPKLAKFYVDTFGMSEVARGQADDKGEAIYLSDGYINLAILPVREGKEGIDHLCFQVDDVRETGRIGK